MARKDKSDTEKTPKQTRHEEILTEAMERFSYAEERLSASKQLQLQDIKFSIGDSDNGYQWPEVIWKQRITDKRPALTMNKIPQFINQVVNDSRQNRPAIKIRPVDSGSDIKSAEIIQGIIRNIESVSRADIAYDTAIESAARCGEGYFRILPEYCDDMSFNQEILIKRIRNPLSVWPDPDYQEPDGSDMGWCFIIDEMPRKEFEREYPDSNRSDWDGGGRFVGWVNKDKVRIAEYYRIIKEKAEVVLLSDGSVIYADEAIPDGLTEVKRRDGYRHKVEWFKLTAGNVLEETEVVGRYIPVIPVIGNEVDIEGRPHRSGLTRNSKDAQRQYNYWTTAETEMIALAPKAPFIGYKGQFTDKKWKDANTRNYAYLEADTDAVNADGTVLPLPQRQQFAGVPAGIVTAKQSSNSDIRETMGIYNASLGAPSNEHSGKAILAKQREADTGTFHYNDNLSRSIKHAGRIIVSWIPKYYDTERVIRILGEDGTPDTVKIDPAAPTALIESKDKNAAIKRIFNPTVGKYDVTVDVGPSYASKRAEAAESMMEMTRVAPEILKVAGDLVVRNMDWPGAQEIADRIKSAMPPELVGKDDNEPVPPKVMAMVKQVEAAQQMIQQQGQALAQKEQELNGTQAQVDAAMKELQAQDKVMRAEFKAAKAELKLMQHDMQTDSEKAAAESLMRYTEQLEHTINQLSAMLDHALSGDEAGEPPEPPAQEATEQETEPTE
ncbi:MAG TPA: portal protein [Methylophilaceae bacterium]|nr:portal protein [Methylophilaceae bacterium]